MSAIASFDNLAREFEALAVDLQDVTAVLADLQQIRQGFDALRAANESLREDLRRTEAALLDAEQTRQREWQALVRQVTLAMEEQAASQQERDASLAECLRNAEEAQAAAAERQARGEASLAESLSRAQEIQAAITEWQAQSAASLAESLRSVEQARAALADWQSRTEADLIGRADALLQKVEDGHSAWEGECRALAESLRSAIEDAKRAGAEQIPWLKSEAAEWQGRAEAAVAQKLAEQEQSLTSRQDRFEQELSRKAEELERAYNLSAGRQLSQEAKWNEDLARIRGEIVDASREMVGLAESVRLEQQEAGLKIEEEAGRLQAAIDGVLARLGKLNVGLNDLADHQEQLAEEASELRQKHDEVLADVEQRFAALASSVDSLAKRLRLLLIGGGFWLVVLTVLTLWSQFR